MDVAIKRPLGIVVREYSPTPTDDISEGVLDILCNFIDRSLS